MESPFVEVHDTSLTDSGQFNVPVPNSGKQDVQLRAEQLTEMVQSLVGSLSAEDHQHVGESEANLLVQARLGMASSLFNALRCTHDETAAHCFRVAVTCSHWAEQMGLSEQERASLEIASLLHDIGKIGVADNVLLKPGELTADEVLVMDRHWEAGLDILRASCSSEPVLEIVRRGPQPDGLGSVSLAEHGVELEPGVDYRWFVTLVYDADRPSRNVVSGGSIRRVPAADALRDELEAAPLAERGHLLARGGYWYDAYDFFAALALRHPDAAALGDHRDRLLAAARAAR